MECNKDEAIRAKEIAERKLSLKDFVGARKFALKARTLFPGLEGIPQMLSTLDVYTSAENKINGESDWYGILGVDPKADDESVRKQYRKLALMLHPDKNKSIGADGAFKLISEAWSLLSDKSKRTVYDQKRNVMKSHQKAKVSTNPNGFNSSKAPKPSTKPPKNNNAARSAHSSAPPAPTFHKAKPNTFWTVCHGCKMQYEYLRVYLNHNLLCPNCHEPFLAKETAPPSSNGSNSSASWNFSQKHHHHHNSSKQTANKKSFNPGTGGFSGSNSHYQNNFQWVPFSRTGAGASNAAAQATSMVQQAYERVKREREEAEAAVRREEALRKKNLSSKKTSSTGLPSAAKRRKEDVSTENSWWNFEYEIGVKVGGATSSFRSTPIVARDFNQIETRSLLMEKARKAVRKKLDELSSVCVTKPKLDEDENHNAKENEGGEKYSRNSNLRRDQPNSMEEAMSISVPDPDFHDFDRDRTEKSFEDNQIWAVYDGDDGMPRYYAMIHSVVSTNPFKLRIGWLNFETNTESGPLNLVASGFAKTCGDFRVGRYEINTSLHSFSHKVRWSKGRRGLIRIYPRKGEVWALYRNWSPDWNELTEDEVIHKYDMVEVIEDYNEELGVTVSPLIKVAGFKTVFHRHLDHKQIITIPIDEIFRFSHHVPSYTLTGQEAPNAPKGCRELDPAATPLELLQVIIDVEEEQSTLEVNDKVINAEQSNKEVNKDDSDVISVEEKTRTKRLKTEQVDHPGASQVG